MIAPSTRIGPYEILTRIGAGGMGEVWRGRDTRIGRDVAMKVARSDVRDPHRFLREARVQGQLEHPAIVPVYDLAYDDADHLYFTMKRVRGVTLEAVLVGLGAGDAEMQAAYGRRKLLSAFVSVSLALEFAHSRGVVHRDLKPSNMMLGDFGEVYVLDWGIAKLFHDEAENSIEPDTATPNEKNATASGTVLGTPGYMAPEQIRGDELDARTDVYALGAILFEIVCGEQLHQARSIPLLASQTLAGVGDRVRSCCRERDVPPELEAAILGATMLDREERFPSARALSNAIERFLDGDQDLERRRALAIEHAAYAKAALGPALSEDEGPSDAARAVAMLEAGRAIALDPTCADAASTLATLMTTPPSTVPPAVHARIDRYRARDAAVAGSMGMFGWVVIACLSPFIFWMGVRDWPLTVLGIVAITVGAITTWGAGRWPAYGKLHMRIALFAAGALLFVLARLWGSLLYTPGVALGAAIALGSHPFAGKWWPYVLACVGIVLPFGLELAGVIAPSYTFDGATMTIHAHLTNLPRVPTLAFLALGDVGLVLSVGLYALTVRGDLQRAQRRLLLQTWQLQQLLPQETLAGTETGKVK